MLHLCGCVPEKLFYVYIKCIKCVIKEQNLGVREVSIIWRQFSSHLQVMFHIKMNIKLFMCHWKQKKNDFFYYQGNASQDESASLPLFVDILTREQV